MAAPRYPVENEYETLRAELLAGKKYVFERPILIWLLSFNLWFTVNGMGSMARIVAYIQLILFSHAVLSLVSTGMYIAYSQGCVCCFRTMLLGYPVLETSCRGSNL